MTRINVYDYNEYDGQTLIGWYDWDRADRYEADARWDGHNHIDINTGSQWDHQILLRTAQGRWVLHTWSQRQGRDDTNEFVDEEAARTWLIANGQDGVVQEWFGAAVEPERGPGRPEVGPAFSLRFPPALLARVDAVAAAEGTSRAAKIRQLVEAAI